MEGKSDSVWFILEIWEEWEIPIRQNTCRIYVLISRVRYQSEATAGP